MDHSTFEVPFSGKHAQDAASPFGQKQKIGTPPQQFVIPNLAAARIME
jgi:hypothetical protein